MNSSSEPECTDTNRSSNGVGDHPLSYSELFQSEEEHNIKTHIFILSSAGKPVYSRYGPEDKLVTLFGVMQALVSFIQDCDDTIQSIEAGDVSVLFLVRGPIILVSVAHNGDSKPNRTRQLLYVYNQIVSVLTLTQVTRIFEQRRNYDLRRLLTGSERLIDHLLEFTENTPEFLLDAVSCVPLPAAVRETISSTIISSCSKIKNVVFAMLISGDRLISLVRMKKYHIDSSDLHIIFNMVCSSESFKTAESWTPICLPNFDSSGFLHAHVSYLDDECLQCLLLLTIDRDLFYPLSEAKQKIIDKLKKNNILGTVNDCIKRPPHSMQSLNIPGMKHFIYKCCRSNQLLVPEWRQPHNEEVGQEEIMSLYRQLVKFMQNESSPSKLMYLQLQSELMLGWVSQKFELYAIFDPLLTKANCIECVNKLLQKVQKEEDKIFIQNIPTF